MKTITLDEMSRLTTELFDRYVEPVACSFMYGEVPTITMMVHRTGSQDSDWLAKVRFKNTTTISVFRCEVFLDDIMRLCRKCKMYLVTREVFRVTATFAMLYPLYQTQHMNFNTNVNTDYDSMMAGAGHATWKFMNRHFEFSSDFEKVVLEILYYHSMIFTNNYKYVPPDINLIEHIDKISDEYNRHMMIHHYYAFKSAKYQKAQTYLLDKDGFICLERKTKGAVRYERQEEK